VSNVIRSLPTKLRDYFDGIPREPISPALGRFDPFRERGGSTEDGGARPGRSPILPAEALMGVKQDLATADAFILQAMPGTPLGHPHSKTGNESYVVRLGGVLTILRANVEDRTGADRWPPSIGDERPNHGDSNMDAPERGPPTGQGWRRPPVVGPLRILWATVTMRLLKAPQYRRPCGTNGEEASGAEDLLTAGAEASVLKRSSSRIQAGGACKIRCRVRC